MFNILIKLIYFKNLLYVKLYTTCAIIDETKKDIMISLSPPNTYKIGTTTIIIKE